jgi:hypothetical protein
MTPLSASPLYSESATVRGTVLRSLCHHRNSTNQECDALIVGHHNGSRSGQLKHHPASSPVLLRPQS